MFAETPECPKTHPHTENYFNMFCVASTSETPTRGPEPAAANDSMLTTRVSFITA